ncbi:sensor domain-containing protein [Mycobacterium riyadhense]|uniref:sensor domain-containing protein n=1 Tax=Mycobacterium riyadhense TaxID=486698 RepID=UPI001959F5AD|nr:sensor domain-containing protein [Mycobacterium riyadhense]
MSVNLQPMPDQRPDGRTYRPYAYVAAGQPPQTAVVGWTTTPMAATPQRWASPDWWYPPASRPTWRWAWALLGVAVVALLMVVGLVAATTGESARPVGGVWRSALAPAPATVSSATSIPAPAPTVVAEPHALWAPLLDADALDTIMDTTGLAVDPLLTTNQLYIDTTDKPECGGVWANANKRVYGGSGWLAVQTQWLHERSNVRHEVYQSVVSFSSAQAAADFVAKEAKNWPLCNGTSLSTTNPNSAPQIWWVATVNQHQGILTALINREGAQGWSCQHALAAHNNIVIDVEACGRDISQQGVAIAAKLAERVH